VLPLQVLQVLPLPFSLRWHQRPLQSPIQRPHSEEWRQVTAGKAQLSKVDLAEQVPAQAQEEEEEEEEEEELAEQVPAQAQEEQQPMQRASGVANSGVANSGVANSARACVLGVEAGNTET
jgi:hypothetical protein